MCLYASASGGRGCTCFLATGSAVADPPEWASGWSASRHQPPSSPLPPGLLSGPPWQPPQPVCAAQVTKERGKALTLLSSLGGAFRSPCLDGNAPAWSVFSLAAAAPIRYDFCLTLPELLYVCVLCKDCPGGQDGNCSSENAPICMENSAQAPCQMPVPARPLAQSLIPRSPHGDGTALRPARQCV